MVLSAPIPPDIIYLIVQELHDDIATLNTASLVSPTFREFSQVYIFQCVSVNINYGALDDHVEHPVERLLNVLHSNPNLASYVQDFSFTSSGEWADGMKLRKRIISDSVLALILRLFQSLKSLAIEVTWELQTPVVQSAILELCELQSLRRISLVRIWGFPIIHLSRLPHIRHFSSSQTGFMRYTEEEIEQCQQGCGASQGSLETLEFGHCNYAYSTLQLIHSTLTHPHSQLTISKLRVFKLNGGSSSTVVEGWKIMLLAARALECFVWDHLNEDTHDPTKALYFSRGRIDIAQLPRLRFLGLSFIVNNPVWGHTPNTTWIINSLQCIAGRSCLESIVLHFHRNPGRELRDELDEFLMPLNFLLTHDNFPRLARVEIYINNGFDSTLDMIFRVVRGLSLPRAAGILSVQHFSHWPEPGEIGVDAVWKRMEYRER